MTEHYRPGKLMLQYGATSAQVEDIEKQFTYHPPISNSNQPDRYVSLRDMAKAYALEIVANTPPSREQSLALTHLEEAVFWMDRRIHQASDLQDE